MTKKTKKRNFIVYIKYMHKMTKGFHKFFPLIFFVSLLLTIISIFTAYISQAAIDNITTQDFGSYVKVILTAIALYIFGSLLNYGSVMINALLGNKLRIKIQKLFYDNMQRSQYLLFQSISSSDIYFRMFNDTNVLIDFYVVVLVTIPLNIITFIVATTIMLIWYWPVALIIIGVLILQLIVMLFFKKPIEKQSREQLDSYQTLLHKINEDNDSNEMTRLLALENYKLNKIARYFETNKTKNLKLTSTTTIASTAFGLVNQITNIVLLLFGVMLINDGRLSLGILLGFSMLSGYIYTSLSSIVTKILSYQQTKVSFVRINEFTDMFDLQRLTGTLPFLLKSEIEFKDLHFQYRKEESLISKLNLKVEKGKITEIEGSNGSGKTTLMKLLLRFFSPQSGEILIDGVPIHKIEYDMYRKNVVGIPSRSIILNESLMENILLGDFFSNQQIANIISSCQLDSLIKKLSEGINTVLGTEISQLSEGEMQKISLARVLIREPNVLILDEPTTHLDNVSTEEILDTIFKYNNNFHSTIIIISHDKRVERIASRVVNLDKLLT